MDKQESIKRATVTQLVKDGHHQEIAEGIARMLVLTPHPDVREELINLFGLQTARVCRNCGRLMSEGYLVDGADTYCSETCAREATGMSPEEFKETLDHADEDEARIYWTEWEG